MSDDVTPPQLRRSQPGNIHTVSERYRGRLDAAEAEAIRDMATTYEVVIEDLRHAINKLETAISNRVASGLPVPVSWLHREQTYKSLIIQAGRRFEEYGGRLGDTLTGSQRVVIALAEQHVHAAIEAQLPGAQSVLGAFSGINDTAMRQITGMLDAGSPLRELLDGFGSYASGVAQNAITTAIVKGVHPSQLAKELRSALDVTKARAALIARTEMYRTFREANRATMKANESIMEGWLWFAHLGGSRTCAACLGMHGSFHDVDEPMGTHPACRCTQVPQTKSWGELGFPSLPETRVTPDMLGSADDFLKRLPESEARRILGALHDDWVRGNIKLVDMVRTIDDPVWGTTRSVASRKLAIEQADNRELLEYKAEVRRAQQQAILDQMDKEAREAALAANRAKLKGPAWYRNVKQRLNGLDADTVSEVEIREIGAFIRKDIEKAMGLKAGELTAIRKQLDKAQVAIDATKKRLDKYISVQTNKGRKDVYWQDEEFSRLNELLYNATKERDTLRDRLMPAGTRRREIESAQREVERYRRYLAEAIDKGDDEFRLRRRRDDLRRAEDRLDAALAVPEVGDYDQLILERIRKLRSVGPEPGTVHQRLNWGRHTVNETKMKRFSEWDDPDVRVDIERLSSVYPTDWVTASQKHGRIIAGRSNRGYAGSNRYDNDGEYTEIVISGYDNATGPATGTKLQHVEETVVHELGHRMERAVPNIARLEREFYDRRTAGETERHMGSGYMSHEYTKPDDFFSDYVGKDYGTSFEIITMGYQYLLTPNVPDRGARLVTDTDYLDFLLGLLAAI